MTADVQAPPCLDDGIDVVAVQNSLDQMRAELRRLNDQLVRGVTDPTARRLANQRSEYLSGQIAQLIDGGIPAPTRHLAPVVELVAHGERTVVRTYVAPETAAQHQRIVLAAVDLVRKYDHHVRCQYRRIAVGAVAELAAAVRGEDRAS